ncbi:hypothetical protein KL930_000855 [Ogataea haglerorum]|uniref:BRO1 domain-containing protein n=1 Tax=Ogataea haglerorum TaxID=1937702 RepID=A0ABQ7RNN3_9ASCO|nr:uncharacterized protein KL911_003538 [Ogataea haglerorum]KAG7700168.1 hypothetical protein KL915_000857 [Ogataea haglerorum]KAG7712410.1 hypothetical protein KL950_000281 [Ogataea haglerorum]KAG7722462.1 hypothetical protein KL913_000282 [Ogataea haglerorum]KAG7723434.1 hypothetical protein KL949_000484 [Ogataea haglerorum]KAG7745453.1 hypothetical protein KL932_000483 [Ogataea haglerorum]
METKLLSVPFRKTDRVSLYTCLKGVIDSEFYQSSSTFDKNLQEIDQLRKAAEAPSYSLESIALLKRYYVQLASLQTKFPEDSIESPWYGTLGVRVDGPFTYRSITYERANVLYQIAAAYSQLALNVDNKHSLDAIKQSCIYLQHSAGYFELLRTHIIPQLTNVPLELRSDVLETLQLLMLAQAQEKFWLFALKSDLKNTVISKLSAQVSQFYADSLALAKKTVCFKKDWIEHIHVKALHFKAAAYYRCSIHSGEQEKYGEEIAYLREAEQVFSTKLPKLDNEIALEDFKMLRQTVYDTLRKAERENDLIYLQDIPKVEPPTKVSMVKSILPEELIDLHKAINSGEYGRPLFEGLVPYSVIQVAMSYKDRVENYFVVNFKEPLEELNKKIDTVISDTGMTAQIEAILKPQSIPNWVWENKEKLEQMRWQSTLRELESELREARRNARPQLVKLWEEVQLARENDQQQRRLHGSKWQVPDFDESGAECYEMLNKLESYLDQSAKGDRIIFQQLKDLKPYLQVYESAESLEEFIPKSQVLDLNPDFKDVVFKLDDKVKHLKKLKNERYEFLENMRIKMNENQILMQVTEQYKKLVSQNIVVDENSMQYILDESLRKFDAELGFLTSTAAIQDSDISLIYDLYDIFKSLKRQLHGGKERETALRVLQDTMSGFREVVDNLKQGIQFYQDYMENLATTRQKVSDFLNDRRLLVSNL